MYRWRVANGAADGVLVLLVEDEPQMRRVLRVALTSHGYRLLEADSGAAGLAAASRARPDVILLDLGLPDMDGVEVMRRLREWTRTPVIVISARGQERDKVAALDAGADDYLTKPFGVPELLARMRVAQRHREAAAGTPEESTFTAGDLRVDIGSRQVFSGGEEKRLTPTEYRLLLDPRAPRRAGGDAPPAARGGLGRGVRRADPVPPRVHGPAPPQARAGPRAAALPRHRAGRRVSPPRHESTAQAGVLMAASRAAPLGTAARGWRWRP